MDREYRSVDAGNVHALQALAWRCDIEPSIYLRGVHADDFDRQAGVQGMARAVLPPRSDP